LSKAARLPLFYLTLVIRWPILLFVEVIIFEKFSILILALKRAILLKFSQLFYYQLLELMAKKSFILIQANMKEWALALSLL
jgi:hypothetical protein